MVMAEYIEREKAFKLIKEQKEKETGAYSKGRNKGLIIAGSIINNKEVLPTADVVEVKHGEWTKVEVIGNGYGQTYYQHKNCTVNSTQLYECPFEHCPRCGAKMDGGS